MLQEERSKAEQETLLNKAGTLTKRPFVRKPEDEPLPTKYIVVSSPLIPELFIRNSSGYRLLLLRLHCAHFVESHVHVMKPS